MTLFERLIYIFCCCCFSGFGASKNFIRDSQRLNSVVLYDSVCVCACVLCVCVVCVYVCVVCVCVSVYFIPPSLFHDRGRAEQINGLVST